MTQAPYLIEVDDDIVSAPEGWDAILLDAFRAFPCMGYLAANLANDPHDTAVRYIRYLREERNAYVRVVENGIAVLEGPTGGGCTMTSREVYDRVGGFHEHPTLVYWREDADYAARVQKAGFRCAILEGLEVVHHGGPFYSPPSPAKIRLHELEHRRRARRDRGQAASCCACRSSPAERPARLVRASPRLRPGRMGSVVARAAVSRARRDAEDRGLRAARYDRLE